MTSSRRGPAGGSGRRPRAAGLGAAVGATLACLPLATPTPAEAWGSTGHRLVSRLALRGLDGAAGGLLSGPEMRFRVEEASREPDRWRGSGQPHDADLDPGHFQKVGDDGLTAAGTTLSAMPPDRESYAAAAAARGASAAAGGWLYYSLLDGWQQAAKDFAYARAETAALAFAPRRERPWLARDLAWRRELLARDVGVLSHYVADAAQPMHVSVHYDGWGQGPNPEGLTREPIHLAFEGAYVARRISEGEVAARLPRRAPCPDPVPVCVAAYLERSRAEVAPLYRLWTRGAFSADAPAARDFTADRLADAAAELQELLRRAAAESVGLRIGAPAVLVADVLAGRVDPTAALRGTD